MKRLLFGFLLGIGLSWLQPVKAQESEIVHIDGLSLRDAVEVLADYELIHPHVPIREEWWGWTDPDERRIFVIANADLSVRRRTVIHELLHVSRRFRNQVSADKQQEEDEVAIASAIMYEQLFGGAK